MVQAVEGTRKQEKRNPPKIISLKSEQPKIISLKLQPPKTNSLKSEPPQNLFPKSDPPGKPCHKSDPPDIIPPKADPGSKMSQKKTKLVEKSDSSLKRNEVLCQKVCLPRPLIIRSKKQQTKKLIFLRIFNKWQGICSCCLASLM